MSNILTFYLGNQPDANIQVYSNRYMLQQFGRLVKMYKMLANYTATVIHECVRYGIPAQRPLVLHYEDDPLAVNSKYQYMYGPDLLIAPVLQANVTKQRVYLPKGEWVFMWNNATIVAGGQYITIPSPIGRPPVFYKKSSPFALTFDTIGMTPLVPPPPTRPPTTQSTNSAVAQFANVVTLILTFYMYLAHELS